MSTQKSMEESKRRSPGGIGITKRAGKYEATYSIPRSQLPEGSPRKRITAWGDSERSATSALMEKLQAPAILSKKQEVEMRKRFGRDGILEKGEYREPDLSHKGPTLAEWVQEWTTDYMSEKLQESTKKIYFGHIDKYILPYIGKRYINDLSTKVLKREWWDPITQLRKVDKNGTLTDQPLLGPSVRANIYKTMRMLLITSYHKHGTRVSLSTRLMPIPTSSRPESDQEVKAAAERLRKIFLDEPDKEDPHWSLFALSLLGLRQGERLAIRLSDIDLSDKEDPVIYIHQQMDFLKGSGWYLKDVTKNGEPRAVPLWGIFLEAVEKQLEWRKKWAKSKEWKPDPQFADLLFLQPEGKIWTRRQDSPAWRKFVGPGIRGHLARHITGHILADEGIGIESAKLLLGHNTDTYAYYYRIASTKEAGRELRAIKPRAPKVAARKSNRLYMVK